LRVEKNRRRIADSTEAAEHCEDRRPQDRGKEEEEEWNGGREAQKVLEGGMVIAFIVPIYPVTGDPSRAMLVGHVSLPNQGGQGHLAASTGSSGLLTRAVKKADTLRVQHTERFQRSNTMCPKDIRTLD